MEADELLCNQSILFMKILEINVVKFREGRILKKKNDTVENSNNNSILL